MFSRRAINLSSAQKASSVLTLVLWPLMTADRLMIGDFIVRPAPTRPVQGESCMQANADL